MLPARCRPPPSLASLAGSFLRIGAAAFGGLGATLALIERELVQRRAALTNEDIAEALTYTKLLPGSTVVQVVAYLGHQLGGWRGSAVATAAFLLPAATLMLLLAAGYAAGVRTAPPQLAGAVRGVTAAVVGLLLVTTFRLGRANLPTPLAGAMALLAFLAAAFLGVNAALLVVVAGLLGCLFTLTPGGGKPKGGGA